jgi:hypothetical protein
MAMKRRLGMYGLGSIRRDSVEEAFFLQHLVVCTLNLSLGALCTLLQDSSFFARYA